MVVELWSRRYGSRLKDFGFREAETKPQKEVIPGVIILTASPRGQREAKRSSGDCGKAERSHLYAA